MKNEYKAAIDREVNKLFYVDKNNEIELYANYDDSAEFLFEMIYEERKNADLKMLIEDKLIEAYSDIVASYEHEILENAGFLGEDFEDEARDYLHETYSFNVPFDHYLKQEMKVNIMFCTETEANFNYGSIHDQYLALSDPESVNSPDEILKESSGLTYLLQQQGHTMNELQSTMDDYNKFFYSDDSENEVDDTDNSKSLSLDERIKNFNMTHNAFLTSVCQELENHRYSMGIMTVLAKLSIEDFIKLQTNNQKIIMPKNCDIGIFNPWNGSGSVLEIELEKPLEFPNDMIRDVQIEGVKLQFEHTVDYVYGLVGSCWKEPISIEDNVKSLDDVIRLSEALSNVQRDTSLDLKHGEMQRG